MGYYLYFVAQITHMKKVLFFVFVLASFSVSGQSIDNYFESIRNNSAELTAQHLIDVMGCARAMRGAQ